MCSKGQQSFSDQFSQRTGLTKTPSRLLLKATIAGGIAKVKMAQSCLTLSHPMDYNRPWNSIGQNSGVGSFSLLQGSLTTQGSNPGLLH